VNAGRRTTFAVVLCCTFGSIGCDRSAERAAEEESLRAQPPVRTGNLNEAMAGERVPPKLPTPDERLMVAVRAGDREKVEDWLSEGARLDSKTPVLVAAVRGNGGLEFVKWLVSRGAEIDVADDAGRTPLSWAAGSGADDQVAYLLNRGANPATTDRLGRRPLHFAVFSGDEKVVRRLLSASADVNAQDSLGATPLMYACAKNHGEIVRALQAAGADPTIEDKLGRTAAERAHGDDNPCTE
jgi:ankyrin repeat protein